MTEIIQIWKNSLQGLLYFYETRRGALFVFIPLLFLFFVLVNIFSYWWAMFTAFPFMINDYYFKVQFPVGILGAIFDTASFFVTIYIIRRALHTQKVSEYVAHLSIDLIIALLATIWVVYVFTISGWLISLVEAAPKDLAARNDRYQQMVIDAAANPTSNLRNIYFGLIMGISAMIPTCIHIYMFIQASWRWMFSPAMPADAS